MPRRDSEPETNIVSQDTPVDQQAAKRYLRTDEYIETDVGKVVMVDNDDDAINEITKILSKKRESELDITQSKVGGRILTDRVFAVEKKKGDYNNVIVVHGKNIKVVIPGNMFFTQEYSVERCNRELDRRIGSKIDYIVKNYEKNDAGDIVIALASRADAMRAKAEVWFIGKDGDAPKLLVGDIVQARVVSEPAEGFVAETGGVETYVRYTTGSDRVSKGSNTLIRINAINRTESGEISYRASQFSAINGGFGATTSDFSVKSKYHGIVSSITNDGLFVDLGGVYCYCKFSSSDRPVLGQSVNVQITGMSKKGFLFATLKHIG